MLSRNRSNWRWRASDHGGNDIVVDSMVGAGGRDVLVYVRNMGLWESILALTLTIG
jgi:hypothetical protein